MSYKSPVLEQIEEAAKVRPLTPVELENLRRLAKDEWILSHKDPYKEIPANMLGKEPWLDLVERYCLA